MVIVTRAADRALDVTDEAHETLTPALESARDECIGFAATVTRIHELFVRRLGERATAGTRTFGHRIATTTLTTRVPDVSNRRRSPRLIPGVEPGLEAPGSVTDTRTIALYASFNAQLNGL